MKHEILPLRQDLKPTFIYALIWHIQYSGSLLSGSVMIFSDCLHFSASWHSVRWGILGSLTDDSVPTPSGDALFHSSGIYFLGGSHVTWTVTGSHRLNWTTSNAFSKQYDPGFFKLNILWTQSNSSWHHTGVEYTLLLIKGIVQAFEAGSDEVNSWSAVHSMHKNTESVSFRK